MIRKINKYLKEVLCRLFHPVNIHNAVNTLATIEKNQISIARFGDGEFDYIFGIDRSFQDANKDMKKRLEDILSSKQKNCLIGIPYAMTSLRPYNFTSKRFWFCYFANKRKLIMPYLDQDKQYFDSQITRIYINRKNKEESQQLFNQWKRIWNNKKVLIVEGALSRCGVGNDLFDGCKKVSRVICPSQNAFDKYENIFTKTVVLAQDYDLVLLALGPTATILAYDLSQVGIWAIDTGNMDNEYEWMRAGVKVPVANKNKYSYEAIGGEDVDEIHNSKYDSEIVERIS